eukprot:CAMPEP_0198669470 /NCGR_PEP_ID=MMETSP1467-20131203/76330_1 /TAXON_ID=1462469 /ORGANISM="unid. sp., Strain CCMP2135" /LENGTH=230 /DNA_ID=CAMNT_0044406225 /DNA_START=4 /DNA_END=696 /DNA_ORIENTATION=-
MTSSEIGVVMSATAVGGITLQIFVFPTLARFVQPTGLFRYSLVLSGLLSMVTPLLTRFGLKKDPMFFLLIAHNIGYQFFKSAVSTAVGCCVNNSAQRKVRGTVNGVGVAASSFLMFIGPTAGGGLYAWSLSSKTLPRRLHGNFVFLAAGVLYFLIAFCGLIYLKPYYDVPVDEDGGPDNEKSDDKVRMMSMEDFSPETKQEEDASGAQSPLGPETKEEEDSSGAHSPRLD